MMSLANRHTLLPRVMGLTALSLCIYASAALGQMRLDPDCDLKEGSPTSCAHVIACIGGEELFVGGAVGWEEGTLYGALSTGAQCTGSWNNADAAAEFTCDDNQRGTVRYHLVDGLTGTAVGSGLTRAGRDIQAWSGNQVAQYIFNETGEVVLQCGMNIVPVS